MTVHVAEQDGSSGAALATEEEFVLRCLGVAIIMQWNALPTTLRREIFDTGKLLETAALRGQIARFLHKHKDEILWLCHGGTTREAQSATAYRCK